jgi:hypothetical protein
MASNVRRIRSERDCVSTWYNLFGYSGDGSEFGISDWIDKIHPGERRLLRMLPVLRAGYSSLARLKELPFSELKLSRSFVDGCSTDEKNSAICQMVIDLAHRFGSVVVGEGIEARADLQALMAMGCDFGQGFLLARPMDKQSFVSVLNQRAEQVRVSTLQTQALHSQPLSIQG